MDRIKKHLKENKDRYITGIVVGVGVAGITVVIVRGTSLQRGLSVDGLQRGPFNNASFIFANRQTVNIVSVLERDGRGHPGYITECVETGRRWASQGEAARWAGVSDSLMSGHLKDKVPDLNGFHYRHVPEEIAR